MLTFELPCRIVAILKLNGRIVAVLEDGRQVDVTDWFTPAGLPN